MPMYVSHRSKAGTIVRDHRADFAVHSTKLKLAMLMEKVIDVQTRVAPVPYSLVTQIDAEFKQCQLSFVAIS